MLKIFGKVAIFMMMVVTVLGMSTCVFGADKITNTGSISIEKNLKVINPTLTSVDGPGVTFNYAIAPETPSASNGGETITDGTHTATVHIGPADGVTLSASSIEYPIGTAVNASASGADNIKSIMANGDITKFSSPGIYRYKVTETATGKDTCGVVNTEGDRYIDVYVENGESGLVFSGFVMHDGTTSEGAPAQKKTFDDASFETVNVVLNKTVTGNMGDKNNEFPFAGTVVDSNRYFYADKGTAPTADDAKKISNGSISTALKHNDVFYISGLSKNATVAYTETNNTADTYTTSVTGGTAVSATPVSAGNSISMTATDVDNAGTVTFTNDFSSVSPTLVVRKYGLGIMFVVVAGLLFFMGLKRKKKA